MQEQRGSTAGLRPWKPGQSGNPKGRAPGSGSVLTLVRRKLRQSGADEELADAIISGLLTGDLKLRHVQVGSGREVAGYSLDASEWMALFRLVYPTPPKPNAGAEDESDDLPLERKLTDGDLDSLAERFRREAAG